MSSTPTGDPTLAAGGARRDTLAVLQRAVAEATDPPRGSSLLVLGPAGSGKTTAVAQALGSLEDDVRLLRVVGDGAHRRQPFALVSALLGATPADGDPTDHLLDQVDEWCAQGPVLVHVDDAHALDSASLGVLRRLAWTADDLPLTLLVTSRPEPDRPALAGLARQAGQVLELGPLDPAEVAALVADRFGGQPDAELQGLLDVGGGNPLFVHELLDDLDARARLYVSGSTVGVHDLGDEVSSPRSLHGVVAAHLDRAGPEVAALVAMVSVIGPPVALDLLAAVTHRTPSSLDVPLRAAVADGVLVWREGDRVDVRHDVFRDVAYAGLADPVRRAEHRRVARALTAAGADPVQVAVHLARGALPGDVAAVDAVQRTALRAGRYAPAVAAELLGDVVELVQGTGARVGDGLPDPDDLVVEQVTALFLSGQSLAGERRALQWLQRGPGPAARAALTTLVIRCQIDRTATGPALRSIDATLAVPALPAPARQELQALRAWVQVLAGDRVGARATLDGLTDTPGMAQHNATTTEAVLAWLDDRPGEALGTQREPGPDEDGSSPLAGRMTSLVWPPSYVLEAEGPGPARAAVERARAVAAERGAVWLRPFLGFVAGAVLVAAGDWDDALTELDSALEAADERATGWISRPMAGAAWLLAHRGDTAGARRRLQQLAEADVVVHFGLDEAARARLALAEAADDAAAAELARALWDDGAARGRHWQVLCAPEVARVALAGGDHELLARVAAEVPAPRSTSGTMTPLVQAQVRAMAAGDPAALEQVVAGFTALGRRTAAVVATEEWACAAAAQGDRGTAEAALAAALAGYAAFGAAADVARLTARARGWGLRRTPRTRPATGWEALTPSEDRVVQLLGAGLTNPQIAERLFLSPRTVQTHVKHAMDKLGLRSRVEIARALARRQPG